MNGLKDHWSVKRLFGGAYCVPVHIVLRPMLMGVCLFMHDETINCSNAGNCTVHILDNNGGNGCMDAAKRRFF